MRTWDKNESSIYFIRVFLLYNVIGAILVMIFNSIFSGDAMTYVQYFTVQLCIVIFALGAARRHGIDILRDASLDRAPNIAQILCLIAIAIVTIQANVRLSNLFVASLAKLGMTVNDISVATNGFFNIILTIICLALLPAFGEEFLIRQGVLSGFARSMKGWQAAALSGIVFSLMHANPAQTVHQLFFGIILAAVVLVSRSLWSSIIVHFTNNMYVILASVIYPETATVDYTAISTTFADWAVAVVMFIVGTGVTILLLGLYSGLCVDRMKDKQELPEDYSYSGDGRKVRVLFATGFSYLKYVMTRRNSLSRSADMRDKMLAAANAIETDNIARQENNEGTTTIIVNTSATAQPTLPKLLSNIGFWLAMALLIMNWVLTFVLSFIEL